MIIRLDIPASVQVLDNWYDVVAYAEVDYSPAEPEVRYYPDGSGYPGCGAEAQLIRIVHLRIEDGPYGGGDAYSLSTLGRVEIQLVADLEADGGEKLLEAVQDYLEKRDETLGY